MEIYIGINLPAGAPAESLSSFYYRRQSKAKRMVLTRGSLFISFYLVLVEVPFEATKILGFNSMSLQHSSS